jgi:hypothetical protein
VEERKKRKEKKRKEKKRKEKKRKEKKKEKMEEALYKNFIWNRQLKIIFLLF